MLRQLGIADAATSLRSSAASTARPLRSNKRNRQDRLLNPTPSMRRYSLRSARSADSVDSAEDAIDTKRRRLDGSDTHVSDADGNAEVKFESSRVFQYVCSDLPFATAAAVEPNASTTSATTTTTTCTTASKTDIGADETCTTTSSDGDIVGFAPMSLQSQCIHTRIAVRDLPKAYSLSFYETATHSSSCSGLLVAGGAGGVVAVCGIDKRHSKTDNTGIDGNDCEQHDDEDDEDDEATALLSFKAHNGWVSQVRFVSSATATSPLLCLSAANDATLKLWDLSESSCIGSRYMDWMTAVLKHQPCQLTHTLVVVRAMQPVQRLGF
jgi:WD40 repeat protein